MTSLRYALLGISASLLLAGSAVAAPKGADAPLRILVVPYTYAFPHFVYMQTQIDDEAKKLGNITISKADGQLSAPKQIGDIEAALAQGIDGLILAPADPDALAPTVREAIKAGVTVVTIDRPVNNVPEVLANVAADNVLGAQAQGEAVEAAFPKGATIVNLQGIPGDKTANDRNKGVHDVLDKRPELYKFVAQQTARFSRDQGLSVSENLLTGLPDAPQVIVAANDDSALGAAQAVKARKLGDKVAVFGYDGSTDALLAVKKGELAATVDQFPGKQGRTAVRTLVDFIRTGNKPAENNILVKPVAITKANLDTAERIGLVGE